uniref:centrosomal protein kizuna n=1 Tax=Euleptes europaea TaxID=460621 RepID=UPI0025410060|nr:centrosomal protein kizuna [Euleptes europaea]
MCGASSPSGDGVSGYDEQLRRIQVQLRDSETKRMELERKMLEYSKSDVCLSKQKHTKLKKYLKEICERQKKSLLRNQDLLKEFDCIEAHIRKFASSSESLQKLKAEYERQVKSHLALQKNSTLKDDGKDNVKQLMMAEARQARVNTTTAMSRGLYHTATIFMGRQMSAVSNTEDFGALQKSSRLTKSFSISDPHVHRQPSQSSDVTDSCVVQTNSDLQRLNQSDKTHGKAYLPAGAKMPVTSGVSSENGRTCCLTVEHQANNCDSNLVESKTSPEVNSLLHGRLSPENKAAGFKSDSFCRSVEGALTHERSELNEQGSKRPISLAFHPEQAVSGNEYSREKFPGIVMMECLSFEGFCYLLQYIEEMTASAASEYMTLYKSKPVSSAELETLISICNQTGSMEQEDLEVCEALVLHQLQRLLQNTMNRCLLPEKALNDESGMLGEKQVRPELSSYFAMTWERLNEHVLFLKKHNVSLTQDVKDMLGTLLILDRNKQDGLVMPLVKENFPEEYEDESSPCNDVTSCSSQTNKTKIKHEKHAQLFGSNGARKHEVTNWSEDESKEESLVEKIPVSGLNIDGCSLKKQKSNATSSEASFSSREKRSPLSRNENQKGKVTTIKSKAFWGDSDDSNSDIEAALRPQVYCSHEDDFSDFYD